MIPRLLGSRGYTANFLARFSAWARSHRQAHAMVTDFKKMHKNQQKIVHSYRNSKFTSSLTITLYNCISSL